MTPRALLTAIGATALTFAVTIVAAAGSPYDAPTDAPQTTVSAIETGSGTHPITTSVPGVRLSSWNDPCVIAL